MKTATLLLAVVCSPAIAYAIPDEPPAEPPPPEPAPEPAQPVAEPPVAQPPAPVVPRLQEDLDDQADQITELQKAMATQQRVNESLREEIAKTRHLQRSVAIAAFVDVGAFAVAGDGSGIRSDFLHQHYPSYSSSISGQWVFMGDPFTTMINSLGDPAETADSREVENDAINSSGRPSVIVNSIGLAIGKTVREDIRIEALAQLLPRPGEDTLSAAHRRLREEMGFDCALGTAFSFVYRADVGGGLVEHEYDHVFIGRFDGTPAPDPAEVEDWRWVDPHVLRGELRRTPERFTCWFRIAFDELAARGLG